MSTILTPRHIDSDVLISMDCYKNLVDALLKRELVTELDIAKVNRLKVRGSVEGFPQLLLDLGMVSEVDLADLISSIGKKKRVLAKDIPDENLLTDVSPRFLKEFAIAGLYANDDEVGVAVVDPYSDYISSSLSLVLEKRIVIHVGVRSEIEAAVSKQCSELATDATVVENDDADIEHLRDIASEAPVIRYVSFLFQRAVEERASDIHLESEGKTLKLRLRIDGVLKEVGAPPNGIAIGVISRIKLLAKLNIAERRLPQDGRIKSHISGKEFDMRISTTPTIHGEGVVIRLLDREQVNLDFGLLGFEGKTLSCFLKTLSLPHGVILVTGPTGSGKTTTLYTALTRLNNEESKIITVEDPVEYELSGVNQIQVKPEIDLGFSNILRAIVRQDPDIIMIGEMRDAETANIAIQSALTGHLVLSTLHTNDAASGIIRLHDMGVDDFLLASTITGILAQRLVRKLCFHCKIPYHPSDELISELNLKEIINNGEARFYSAVGCKECAGTGYKGRLAVVEFLEMTESIRQQVMAKATASEIKTKAIEEGMEVMLEDGLKKAASGLTTLEEAVRLTKVN